MAKRAEIYLGHPAEVSARRGAKHSPKSKNECLKLILVIEINASMFLAPNIGLYKKSKISSFFEVSWSQRSADFSGTIKI